jgi:hypothetical protein
MSSLPPEPETSAFDCLCELTALTGLTPAELNDLLSLSGPDQELALMGYRDLDWTKPGTPAGARVLTVLGILASLVPVLSLATGSINLVNALKAL